MTSIIKKSALKSLELKGAIEIKLLGQKSIPEFSNIRSSFKWHVKFDNIYTSSLNITFFKQGQIFQ